MIPSFVPAAAATPLPDAPAASGATPDTGAQFDEALDASLVETGTPVPRTSTPAASARTFADPLAIAEWMLLGVPATDDAPAPAVGASSSADEVTAEDDAGAEPASGAAWWDIPMDALLAVPAPMQDALLRQPEPTTPSEPLDVVISVRTAHDQAPPSDLPLTNRQAGSREQNLSTAPPVDHFRQPTGVNTGGAKSGEMAASRIAAPVERDAIRARANADGLAVDRGQASAPSARVSTTADVSAIEPAFIEADKVSPRPEAVRTGSASLRVAAVDQPMSAPAPAALKDAATHGEASQVLAAAAATAMAEGSAAAAVREARGGGSTQGASPDAARSFAMAENAPNQGGAQSFEGDGRQSAASMRLAAALSTSGAAPVETGAAATPVFSVPAAPAPTAPAAVAAATIITPAGQPVTVDPENVTNIVEAMRVTARNGGWEATVRLRPEHLGEVTIALRVDGSNNVSAVVNAEAAGVRQWLMGQEESVRSGMAEHGLQLQKFEIERDGQRGQQQEPQEQPRRRPQRRAQGEAAERFEIVV